MQRTDLTEKEYNELITKISQIVMDKGLKATTMDTVAVSLGMSKRTLYEIFGSKSDMLRETFRQLGLRNKENVREMINSSQNVMEGLIKVFKQNRDWLSSVNVEFFRDMDRLYKEERECYENSHDSHYGEMLSLFERGVKEGMFRKDVDFIVQSRIMGIQMESLKRMEEIFPEDITLIRVYDAIILGFLRGLASPKGMKLLDTLTQELVHN